MASVNLADIAIPAWLNRVTHDQLNIASQTPAHAERWKYTKAQKVLDLIEGATEQPSISGLEQNGVSIGTTIDPDLAALLYDDNAPEAYIAACLANEVLYIDIQESLASPINLSHGASTVPVVIRLAANVAAELFEDCQANEDAIHLLWIQMGPASSLVHSRQSFETAASHWQFLHTLQERMSTYTLHNHTLGAHLRRQDLHVTLNGEGAKFELKSAAFVRSKDHLDQQLTVQHTAPRTTSRQLLNNIAADKASVTCNGRIHIHPNAPQSDADLSNRNLALGKSATVNTKPELEIYTDDVKCSHGATVGQLADDAIFYFTSRGIAPDLAQQILSKGFLLENVAGPNKDCASHALSQALMDSLTGAAS